MNHTIQISDAYDDANVLTHTAPHHADEIFATAILSFLMPIRVFRSRDREKIAAFQGFVYDVGGVYEASQKRFDHHQKDFVKCRENGIKYSSAGLVWEHYAEEILELYNCPPEYSILVKKRVDQSLLMGVDAADNGQSEGGMQMSVSLALDLFNKNWDEAEESATEGFLKACAYAADLLHRLILSSISLMKGRSCVENAIRQNKGSVLILPQYINGMTEAVLDSESEQAQNILYIIFPNRSGNWNIRAVPPSKQEPMKQRKPLPEAWRGLSGHKLEEICGIKEAVFCHASGFFAVAGSEEAAVRMAEKASIR
ncbi:MYG1 family protein [Bacteroides heparinolyticus]|uniref:MYG1 family protein n=1 Tax=Prevotella heparinolytica TaxID=28113 RepID=UPI0035A07938